jgi:hypothetical protein
METIEVEKTEVEEKEELIKKMTDKYNELGQESYLISHMMDQESKTGRNNRCHCGSMNKYKNCCLPLYEEKRTRLIELRDDMSGIASEIRDIYKEIKEINDQNTK